MTIATLIGINPLQTTETGVGIVSSRVALLLRSAEIQPFSFDLFGSPPKLPGGVWLEVRSCFGLAQTHKCMLGTAVVSTPAGSGRCYSLFLNALLVLLVSTL